MLLRVYRQLIDAMAHFTRQEIFLRQRGSRCGQPVSSRAAVSAMPEQSVKVFTLWRFIDVYSHLFTN
ncbi:Uncharacterised protein [Raoultella terrigena]|uniref:Uncharacterized protein n=1 Tax=Raoultella terrigena TaxID=577 RepID=A0A4U9DBS4_RAOTE|nr:Uncharacterised protein [Raoultella terrigena]